MNATQHLASAITTGTAAFTIGGFLLAWLAAPKGAPSMRAAAGITFRYVTGRGRRSAPISAPRPVALSLNSTQPVFIPPHIGRPVSEGTPPISLAFERRARRHLTAINGGEAA